MNSEFLAAFDSKVRNVLASSFPPKLTVKLYSSGRNVFLTKLSSEKPTRRTPPEELQCTLWGLKFQSPIFNAAGMFKNGDAYNLCAQHGAGAFLAGTSTFNARAGNSKLGIKLPFAPYPRSGAASNWLGLPNEGDAKIAERLASQTKIDGIPLGMSVMGSPDLEGDEKLEKLIAGLKLYETANVDFLEINESCPNTEDGAPQDDGLYERLKSIQSEFLNARKRALPVIVKFSNDTDLNQVPDLMRMLLELGFDGVNFGNSSTQYSRYEANIAYQEKRLYQYYTETFGGGLTGRPLKECSLELTKTAKKYLDEHPPEREFHIIRTGGIENGHDVQTSLDAGASLVQWYTAFFERFAEDGHAVYEAIWRSLLASKNTQ